MTTKLRPTSSLIALGLLATANCSFSTTGPSQDHAVLIVAPSEPDAAVLRVVESTERYLGQITDTPIHTEFVDTTDFGSLQALARGAHAGLVVVVDAQVAAADEIEASQIAALGPSDFVLQTRDTGTWDNLLGSEGSTFVLMAGTTRLSRQYGAYEFLRRMGARFFHPEQEYVPRHDAADLRELANTPTALARGTDTYAPDFSSRSFSFHSSHPLEHLEAFSDANHPIDEAVNVNDWLVKNFATRFRGVGRGISSEASRAFRTGELEELRELLGFPQGVGISLHNLQQGASAEIDPLSDIPVQVQIETLVDQKLDEVPDAQWFGIHFGPTEFTVTPDQQTVQWINWAGQRALQRSPDIAVIINNHITGNQPSPNYDDLGCPNGTNDDGRIDYYDLAFHTDPALAVNVHTVMFYPLEGEARVYNQKTFAHKLCLMQQASDQGRRVDWFPEGSWWLSFDNSVPVYLPLYIWTRHRDIELIRPLLASRGGGTVQGHRMFNSGHEWGYWQQDYAVGLLAWNADISVEQILDELFDPLCDPSQWRTGCTAKTTAEAVMNELIEHQRDYFLDRTDWQGRPGGLYPYFAGEDQADEIAAASGLEFRPVRVSFREVASWDAEELDAFEASDITALRDSAALHQGWVQRLTAVADRIPDSGQPWFDEFVDGVEINYLRAQQTAELYAAVVAMRRAQLEDQADPAAAASEAMTRARESLAAAREVIARREANYRYPAEQVYGGGLTSQTAKENGTTYPYRVHTKTNLLTYWENRDALAASIIAGEEASTASGLRVTPAIAATGEAVTIDWPNLENLGGEIQVGQQSIDPTVTTLALDGPGYFAVEGEILSTGTSIPVAGGVARSEVVARSASDGLQLTSPDDATAQAVLGSVFPPMQFAWIDEPRGLVLGPQSAQDDDVPFDLVRYAEVIEPDGTAFTTAPVTLRIPVAVSAGGTALFVTVSDTVFRGTTDGSSISTPILWEGRISIPDVVAAAIELAGFDENGAVSIVAGIFGFDADDPPQTAPFAAELTLDP